MKEPPFKFDTYLRKINKTLPQNVDALIKYLDENTKVTKHVDINFKERRLNHEENLKAKKDIE